MNSRQFRSLSDGSQYNYSGYFKPWDRFNNPVNLIAKYPIEVDVKIHLGCFYLVVDSDNLLNERHCQQLLQHAARRFKEAYDCEFFKTYAERSRNKNNIFIYIGRVVPGEYCSFDPEKAWFFTDKNYEAYGGITGRPPAV